MIQEYKDKEDVALTFEKHIGSCHARETSTYLKRHLRDWLLKNIVDNLLYHRLHKPLSLYEVSCLYARRSTFFCDQTTHLKRILKSLWAHNKIVNRSLYIHTSKENVYINCTSENVRYYVMFWLLEWALNLNNGCKYLVNVVGRWVSWLSGIIRSYKKFMKCCRTIVHKTTVFNWNGF